MSERRARRRQTTSRRAGLDRRSQSLLHRLRRLRSLNGDGSIRGEINGETETEAAEKSDADDDDVDG